MVIARQAGARTVALCPTCPTVRRQHVLASKNRVPGVVVLEAECEQIPGKEAMPGVEGPGCRQVRCWRGAVPQGEGEGGDFLERHYFCF